MNELDVVMYEISTMINNNDYPVEVVKDVRHRLSDCVNVGYANLQLRYLVNYKKGKLDKKLNESGN
ncbi:MAG: DUF6877 family protein [Vagococcus salmoninarum]